jgi:MoxR-like ATPase
MSKMKIDSKGLAEIIAEKLLKGELKDLADLSVESLVESSVEKAPEEEEVVVKPKLDMDPSLYKEIGDCFMVQDAVYKLLSRNVKKGVNTMLLGPTGVGKTELVANIARETDMPLTIFDMGTMTDPIMSLVGTHAIEVKDGITTSTFKRSRFSQVIQQPGIVLLDEISRASAAANNLLFPCLDFRRTLAMEYDFTDSTPVEIHPECVFISTANLGSQYTGTHKLDRALVDRFMTIEIDPLGTDSISKIVKHNYPSIKAPQRKKIVECYDAINVAHDEYKISFNLSLRHLKIICGMVVDGFTIYDAFYMVCKGIGNRDGVKAIETILITTK